MAANQEIPQFVIGTAGHIDHGKSSLVKALTGVDPDRLPIEKERGMTTDLGFAQLTLPSGRSASIVDVPGHERFVGTMVAGATGMNAVILVVAANEGVMPQTREHLEILDLLEVCHGVVALTKTDLVDSETLQRSYRQVLALTSETSLRSLAVVPVSAVDGTGLSRLSDVLDHVLQSASETGVADELSRMPIDRAFTVAGFGPVVTGTISGGVITRGQRIQVLPSRLQARVRGIQSHGVQVDVTPQRGRVALNLSGIGVTDLRRGDVVTIPDGIPVVKHVGASMRVVTSIPFSIDASLDLSIHLGTSRVAASIRPMQPDDMVPRPRAWVRIRFSRPQPVWRGQRFIVRSSGPSATVAGGTILDLAPQIGLSEEDLNKRLVALHGPDTEAAVRTILHRERLTIHEIARRLSLGRERAATVMSRLEERGAVQRLGSSYMSIESYRTLQERTLEVLDRSQVAVPGATSIGRDDFRRHSGLPPPEFAELLRKLVSDGRVVRSSHFSRTGYALSSDAHALPSDLQIRARGGGAARVLDALQKAGMRPDRMKDLLSHMQATHDDVNLLLRHGMVVRLEGEIYVTTAVCEVARREAIALLDRDGGFTVGHLRDALKTSRKVALAFAGYLDDQNITRRVDDRRVPGRALRAHRC